MSLAADALQTSNPIFAPNLKHFSRIALVYWFPAIIWMAVIFGASSIPGQNLPQTELSHIDKLIHAAEYLILGFLLIRALSASSDKISLAKMVISAIIIASLYAAFDERRQLYVEGRYCDIFDFLADFAGANIGIILYRFKRLRHG